MPRKKTEKYFKQVWSDSDEDEENNDFYGELLEDHDNLKELNCEGDYQKQTNNKLKKLLQLRGLSITGTKRTMINRLILFDKEYSGPKKDYNKMYVYQLKPLLKNRGLSTRGYKYDFVHRLQQADNIHRPKYSEDDKVDISYVELEEDKEGYIKLKKKAKSKIKDSIVINDEPTHIDKEFSVEI